MPWWSWSISATTCHTGQKLAQVEGTVCSGCYALKGNYRFQNVVEAQARRLAASTHPDFVDAFVIVLTRLHKASRKGENRFRWFDAGDLQSVDMLRRIVQIAERTPQIRHWLPTRELDILREFFKEGGTLPPNLVVRTSTPLVGVMPNGRSFELPLATVGVDLDDLHQCPALLEQGNRCLACDHCWTDQDVNYPLH